MKDGSKLHAVCPFTGERYAIVYYTPSGIDQSSSAVQAAAALGFELDLASTAGLQLLTRPRPLCDAPDALRACDWGFNR